MNRQPYDHVSDQRVVIARKNPNKSRIGEKGALGVTVLPRIPEWHFQTGNAHRVMNKTSAVARGACRRFRVNFVRKLV